MKPNLRSIVPALLLAALTVLASCGGGVGSGGTGTGATTGYAEGPISGLGSIIVSGVRFDDVSAEVQDLDGNRRGREELRLGMTVEVESGTIEFNNSGSGSVNASASATRIRFESELQGLVGRVDVADSSFTILGQRVTVDPTTVFDERLPAGLAGLQVNQPVEVYAVFDGALQRYRATRVEPSTVIAGLRLRGPVAALDTTTRTLRVGSVIYSYASATDVPANLAVGSYVRLRLAPELLRTAWVVTRFGAALSLLPDSDGSRLEGLITRFTSSSSFEVNGRAVDASGATLNGSGSLGVGVRLEVEGSIRGGVIRATKLSIKSDGDISDRGFDLFGPITVVNTPPGSIVVRGLTISTARSDLRFDDGTAADLAVGRRVEVRAQLSADRRSLEATRIRFR
jgi:Domain of unknown function (DUF5666)